MKNWLSPIVLKGKLVTLRPLLPADKDQLVAAASDGNLWELWYTSVPSSENIDSYINQAMENQQKGIALPFVIEHNASGQIIGSSRYCKADAANKRLEIGYTWYAKSYQRTGVNTECKYLMLEYAFEKLDCIAVQFMTHWFNYKSRNAILRLGAKQDGVIRNHRIDKNGHIRDTVLFSILNSEWPVVKQNLSFKKNTY